MKARAPGKAVLSGAYAVLEGAPALVTAVDRYVVADDQTEAEYVTEEVHAAQVRPVFFDASQLRKENRKLGLGSSAAILVASLLLRGERAEDHTSRTRLFRRAVAAHREAQGGGSGIDVAASTFGGHLRYQLEKRGPTWQAVVLPSQVTTELWSSPEAASTKNFVAQVQRAKREQPDDFARVMTRLTSFARAASESVVTPGQPEEPGLGARFLAALAGQAQALADLGDLAAVPICTPALKTLILLAQRENAVLMPAGAGGGDIALYAGLRPPSASLARALGEHQHERLSLRMGAPGARLLPP